jgi:hypothetical protein
MSVSLFSHRGCTHFPEKQLSVFFLLYGTWAESQGPVLPSRPSNPEATTLRWFLWGFLRYHWANCFPGLASNPHPLDVCIPVQLKWVFILVFFEFFVVDLISGPQAC